MNSSLVKIINLPKIEDERGNLTFLQNPHQIPFTVKRVFWTYDVPGGQIRGGHAFKKQEEIIIALSGSFDVVITSPEGTQQRFQLNRSYYGLYLPPQTWRHIENHSTNALALHMVSHFFDEEDYIRNFNEFNYGTK